ncbi:hypothetical protein L2E82_29520 [Cichorium intybus]|uniref:Uncharacterized protein n=1 Tax=Cichorium intybus TaxID=13427 RepID=A0ACB9CXZ6_CICIN|nr:hypothetical protein L2E82_29520 [Cichorium intybus]
MAWQQYYNNELHNNGNFVPPLYFAQPIRQSVVSHFQPREYDDASPIYFPNNVESQIEIRPQLLGVLPEFRGYGQDHPYNHFYEFLAIANANIPRNSNSNFFRLRLFPFTLKDKTKYWFTSLQLNSITTWELLKTKFLQEFYPTSKTSEIRRAIHDFQQKPGEAFHDVFEILKELMRSCPHHEFPKWQIVKFFFDGVDTTNQTMINALSSGTIMMQDPEAAWRFLEQLSNGSKTNYSSRKPVNTSLAAAVGVDNEWKKGNNYQAPPPNQPQQFQHANNGPSSSNNNKKIANSNHNAPETQADLIKKMNEFMNASQQQTQANTKSISNMEWQIAQLAVDQRRKDDGKLYSNTEVNPTHTEHVRKEHVNVVESCVQEKLKDAPKDSRILKEICQEEEKVKVPKPEKVRLTVKAREALLGTLPKKEKNPGSPYIIVANKELEPAKTVLQLADQSTKVSRGMLRNVIVKVGDFFYPVDFLVMEYESLEDASTLILRRPFLATAGSVMDCKTGRDAEKGKPRRACLSEPNTQGFSFIRVSWISVYCAADFDRSSGLISRTPRRGEFMNRGAAFESTRDGSASTIGSTLCARAPISAVSRCIGGD